MSVEPCIVRITQQEFDRVCANPHTLEELIEDGYASGVFSFQWSPDMPLTRMLHLDEFAMWLLTGFFDDTPLCRALVGPDAPVIAGAKRGHGDVHYHSPEDVTRIVNELELLPGAVLRERFDDRADDFRLAATGFLDSDEAILAFQRKHFDRLCTFYREAANTGDVVLLMLV